MSLAVGELHEWFAAPEIPETVAMECLAEEKRERAARFRTTSLLATGTLPDEPFSAVS